MPRPSTQAEYLASLVPPSSRAFSRRTMLRGALGAGALLATPAGLAACSSGSSSTGSATGGAGGGGGATGTVTLGSNQSDAVPKAAIQSVMDAFQKANSGLTVKINTVDHNTFQENINNYLPGAPDDVFTWFSGYRMRFFASKGLAGDVTDVWSGLSGMSDALKKASTGDDGKQYFIPSTYYPWAVFYRKSVFAEKGYQVPKTLDNLKTLGAQMQKDGLTPIAFADKDGWPAMGTFDYLNMRTNGYQFHIDLCAHKEAWNSPQVTEVFDTWKQLREYQDPAALGLTWQEAAQKLGKKQAGMYLLGSFVTQQFTDKAVLDDVDFFPFPEVKTEGTDAVEAPIDGLMLSKRGAQNQAAKDMLAFLGTGAGQGAYNKIDPSNIMTAKDADTSGYSEFIKKLAGVIGEAKNISQFFDRDALPAMASNVMIPTLQSFTKSGSVDLASVEKQAKSLYADA